MSKYQLKSLEDGRLFDLPSSEIVVGRGAFLEVSNKKVSRNHASFVVKDDKLIVKALHANPCFIRPNGTKSKQKTLKKDQTEILHQSDVVCLLPNDELMYEVVHIEPEKDSQETQDESPPTPTEEFLNELRNEGVEKEKNDLVPIKAVKKKKIEEELPPPMDRKRKLPKWMMNASTTSTTSAASPTKHPAPRVADNANGSPVKKKRVSISDEEETPFKVEKKKPQRKKRISISDEDEEEKKVKTEKNIPKRNAKKKRISISDEEDDKDIDDDDDDEKEEIIPQKKTRARNTRKPRTVSLSDEDNDVDDDEEEKDGKVDKKKQEKKNKRKKCTFGKKCYRKNPVHFKDFCHPGDETYDEKEEELDEETLLRKIRLRTAKKKKTKTILAGESDDSDLPNTYDYNDSFINDDGSSIQYDDSSSYEGSDDDDWDPNDGNDDIGELVGDAKKYLRNRKL